MRKGRPQEWPPLLTWTSRSKENPGVARGDPGIGFPRVGCLSRDVSVPDFRPCPVGFVTRCWAPVVRQSVLR